MRINYSSSNDKHNHGCLKTEPINTIIDAMIQDRSSKTCAATVSNSHEVPYEHGFVAVWDLTVFSKHDLHRYSRGLQISSITNA